MRYTGDEDGGCLFYLFLLGTLPMVSELAFEDTDKPLLSMKKTYIYIYIHHTMLFSSPSPSYIYGGERKKYAVIS